MAGSDSSQKFTDSGKFLFPRRNRRSRLRYLAGYAMDNYSGSETGSGDYDSDVGQRASTGSLEVETALSGDRLKILARGDAHECTDRAEDSGGSLKLLVADADGEIWRAKEILMGKWIMREVRQIPAVTFSHMSVLIRLIFCSPTVIYISPN